MDLTTDDRHNMQLDDPKYIPNPTVNGRFPPAFYVPVGMNIAYESDLVTPLTSSLTVLL
jgi:hypothetical protein